MDFKKNKLYLSDIINLELLQNFQDFFTKTTGFASITLEEKGPITKPSISESCNNQEKNTIENDINNFKWEILSIENTKPIVYKNENGHVSLIAPITLEKEHSASILASRNFDKQLDGKECSIKINKTEITSNQQIKYASDFLHLISNTISKIGNTKLQLIKQNNQEKTLREIISVLGSTLNLEEIKNEIVNKTGLYLKADRVFWGDFNPDTGKYTITENGEYKSGEELESIIGFDFTSIPGFIENIRDKHINGEDVIIKDLKIYDNEQSLKLKPLADFFKNQGFMTFLAININYENLYFGNLVVAFTQQEEISQDDIDFIKIITKQAGFVAYQAMLFKEKEEQIKKEKLINEITTKSLSTFDLNQIKQIVSAIGVMTGADRCFLVEADYDNLRGKPIDFQGEYLKSDDIKTIIGYEFSTADVEAFINIYTTSKDLVLFDYEKIREENNPCQQGMINYCNLFDLKSGIGIPIFYRSKLVAVFGIEYIKEKILLNQKELDFLRLLGKQISMVYNQITLYQNTVKQAERERVLRKITETIRQSLNLDETLSFICKEITETFDIQRTSIVKFVKENHHTGYELKKEYKTSADIMGFSKLDCLYEISDFWNQALSDKKYFIVEDLSKSDTPDYFKDAYSTLGVKTLLGMLINNNNKVWGNLVLSEYKKIRKWSTDEIEFLDAITNQIYIAINQAEIFENQKQMTEREHLLKTITERIRRSLDIDETLSYICEEVAKVFNVQRASISIPQNIELIENYTLKKEYKTSENIQGIINLSNLREIRLAWEKHLATGDKILAFDNILSPEVPEIFKNLYSNIGVKSIIGAAIQKGEDVSGFIVLSEYNEYRHWTEEEKLLLKMIADQTYIAIIQAELYEKQKQTAERERISRNIIEILRSSIDKAIIKKLFVKNIGKFFNADRVFFSEYASEQKIYLPVDNDSEYLSDSAQKSVIGFDWTNPNIQEHIQQLLEKREIKIEDWSEYAQTHPFMSEDFRHLHEDANIKSSYSFPVLYQEKIIGYFCLEFTKQIFKLKEEDIERIRNICTQAGIAIYHADLYLKAQQCEFSKNSFKTEIINKITEPTNNILDASKTLAEKELNRDSQIKYLNNIIKSCNQLVDLTTQLEN